MDDLLSNFPIKSVGVSLLALYLLVSMNSIQVPDDLRGELAQHEGLRLLVIFLMSYLLIGAGMGNFGYTNMTQQAAGAAVVTGLFYVFTTHQLLGRSIKKLDEYI